MKKFSILFLVLFLAIFNRLSAVAQVNSIPISSCNNTFDLTSLNPILSTGVINYSIDFYQTIVDANNETNIISAPNAYIRINNESLFARTNNLDFATFAISNIQLENFLPLGLSISAIDGSLVADVSGGSAPFSYQWSSNASVLVNDTNSLLLPVPNGILTTYELLVTDSCGNSTTANYIVNNSQNITAVFDVIQYIYKADNSPTISILTNDSLNNISPINPNEVVITVQNLPAGITLNSDGTFSIADSTILGSYNFNYQICEATNNNNCVSSFGVIIITRNISTVIDVINYENGPNALPSLSVLNNDTLNELSPINASDVVVSSSNLPAGCILNVDGTFSVVLGTPSGNYSFDYQVCEIANPNNCIIGSGILILTKNINASADFIQYEIAPNAAPIQSIIANDTLNGVSPINTGDVIVTATNLPVGVLLNNDGTLTFAQNFGATNFSFDYQICESNSTNNCANSTCFVVITKNINSAYDVIQFVNKFNGATSASVLENDILNGISPINSDDINISATNLSTGINLNSDGTFSVAIGTPFGSYSFNYQICESAYPDNCTSGSGLLIITRNISTVIDVIQYENSPNASPSISVLDNDTLNNVSPINPSDVTISATNLPLGCTLNADGTISVLVGTEPGTFNFGYQICEIANPNNCILGTGVLILTKNIDASFDLINLMSSTGGTTTSILDNDILNNNTPLPSNVVISSSDLPSGFIINNDGTIEIPSSYTQGCFFFNYSICESAFANSCDTTYIVLVIQAPFAPDGDSIQNIPASGTLAGLQVNGQNIQWYSSAANKSANASNTPISATTSVVDGTTYFATQTVNGIESNDRLSVLVTSATLSATALVFESLKIYPNPINDILTIANSNSIDSVEIISYLGQLISNVKVNDLLANINVSDLSKGVYFVKISSQDQFKTIKIIKN